MTLLLPSPPIRKEPHYHWIVYWVSSRTSSVLVEKTKNALSMLEVKPWFLRPTYQPSCYTNWAILASMKYVEAV
jgi:hypothetical protein